MTVAQNYATFLSIITCPQCGTPVTQKDSDTLICSGNCNCSFPIYHGIPVMIHEKNPVFSSADFIHKEGGDLFFKPTQNKFVQLLQSIRPDITLNSASKKNYLHIAELLKSIDAPRILIIGGSVDGNGIKHLKETLPANAVLVESDVAHGPNTNIILDSHAIPFQDNSFDLIIAQAVLEHVLDPYRCVEEIFRVLKEDGLVYAETPFMQQVHGGKYDFHRFSPLGHRRLFRKFTAVDAGIVAGPGSSLAWSLRYFITSFAPNKQIDRILSYGADFLVFWLKYFDYLLNQHKGASDAACGLYFLGQKKGDYVLSDADLLKQYNGYRF